MPSGMDILPIIENYTGPETLHELGIGFILTSSYSGGV